MAGPVFILATDLRPREATWAHAESQAAGLQAFAARTLGVAPGWTLPAYRHYRRKTRASTTSVG